MEAVQDMVVEERDRRTYTRRREYVTVPIVGTSEHRVEERIGGRLSRVVGKFSTQTKANIVVDAINRAIDGFIADNSTSRT